MAVEEPEDKVILGEFVLLPFVPGDTLTLDGAPHTVVSVAPDRRQLVIRPGKPKK